MSQTNPESLLRSRIEEPSVRPEHELPAAAEEMARAKYADGQSLPDGSMAEIAGDLSALNAPIEGLPSWGMSERFTISGEVPGDASKEMMMGPMM